AVVVVWRVSPALVSKFVDIAAQSTGRGNSTSIRENLILNGWQFFVETGGMGVGAAGFESRIESGAFDHPLFGRATNPHNLWVELLSQYGLVGITTVVLILFLAVRAAAPLRRPSRFGVAYATALVVYVLAAMTASSYVNEPVSWTFFVTFVAIGVWADASRRAAS
ncbi:MAG: O-antigen ligase family protein, partial [Ilumatobacteraceae bacterium]